ncbi:MAG: Crp/Fnr family transcriptional regulator, partial [Bacteroidota bacterium]
MYPAETIKQLVSLSREEEHLVDGLFESRQMAKDQNLLSYGQVCHLVGLVEKGCLRYFMLKDGEEITYSFAQAGDFVSNYESFLNRAPSNKIIKSVEDTKIWLLHREHLDRIYREVKAGNRFGRLVIEKVFVETLRQLSSYYTDSPTERYLKFNTEYPELVQRIPQYLIASYVGVKP